MESKKIVRKVQTVILLCVLISMMASLTRQIIIKKRVDLSLSVRKAELSDLERKNKELEARLEEVKSPRFLDEQAQKLLGLGIAGEVIPTPPVQEISDLRLKTEREIPKYKQWLNLFLE